MLQFLEEQIQEQAEHRVPKWTALLANWIVAVGVVRHRHIGRSYPVRLSRSTLHCRCLKGKQAGTREGFSWTIPSTFSNGWPWAEKVLELREMLPAETKLSAGLCFNEEGKPWAIRESQLVAREVFTGQIACVDDLSAYSWRRAMPTLGHLARFEGRQLLALGDWTDRTTQAQTRSLARADRALSLDQHTVWQGQADLAEVQQAFRFVEFQRKRAEEAPPSEPMPQMLNERYLTKHLRNGQALCVKFQCDGSRCEELHKCAALMQTGRACGGAHPAAECRGRRMLKEPPAQRAAEGPSSVPILPEMKGVSLSDSDDEASSEESVASEVEVEEPAPKRPKQSAKPKIKAKARPGRPGQQVGGVAAGPAEEDVLEIPDAVTPAAAAGDRRFDRLATVRGKTAQKPTLILRTRSQGCLWVGGLPTARSGELPPGAPPDCLFPGDVVLSRWSGVAGSIGPLLWHSHSAEGGGLPAGVAPGEELLVER